MPIDFSNVKDSSITSVAREQSVNVIKALLISQYGEENVSQISATMFAICIGYTAEGNEVNITIDITAKTPYERKTKTKVIKQFNRQELEKEFQEKQAENSKKNAERTEIKKKRIEADEKRRQKARELRAEREAKKTT